MGLCKFLIPLQKPWRNFTNSLLQFSNVPSAPIHGSLQINTKDTNSHGSLCRYTTVAYRAVVVDGAEHTQVSVENIGHNPDVISNNIAQDIVNYYPTKTRALRLRAYLVV